MPPASCLFVALVALLTGCASRRPLPVRPDPESLPAASPLRSRSLRESDAWLRHYLMVGEYPRALEAVAPRSPLAPRDRLVRALQEGIVLRAAGRYEESNRALEWAEAEADLRYTRSVTRAAASLLVNDGVMAYSPPAAELVMLPYYRILNYLAVGDGTGALVEARRANALLARLRREPGDRCHEDGMLQYLVGLVQERGGERSDALVSLRQAERSFAACDAPPEGVKRGVAADLHRVARAAGVTEVADSVAARYELAAAEPAPGGDLLVLVEHGFVAHRAEETLHVPVFPEDVEGLESGDEGGIFAAAGRVTTRLLRTSWERQTWGRSWSDEPIVQWVNALEGAYVLRLAWPTLRLEATRPTGVRVWVGDSLAAATPAADLSAVMHHELDERRLAIMSRVVARGMVKYLVSREMEKKSEKKGGEFAAFVVGRLANLAGNQLERADLRSWSLLPDRISMVRARLPEGVHRVRIETVGRNGEVVSTRDLGEVTIRTGELAVVSERIWGEESGDLPLPRFREEWLAADTARPIPSALRADSLAADSAEREPREVPRASRGAVRVQSCPDNVEQSRCETPRRPVPAGPAARPDPLRPEGSRPGRRRPPEEGGGPVRRESAPPGPPAVAP